MIINLIMVASLYLFLNTKIFFEYIIKNVEGTTNIDNSLTNKGEIVKFLVFIIFYFFIYWLS